MTAPFVPDHYESPTGMKLSEMRLEPLGPQHSERDHAAWMSSVEHIHRSTDSETARIRGSCR